MFTQHSIDSPETGDLSNYISFISHERRILIWSSWKYVKNKVAVSISNDLLILGYNTDTTKQKKPIETY